VFSTQVVICVYKEDVCCIYIQIPMPGYMCMGGCLVHIQACCAHKDMCGVHGI
jgi:hypothetical protein